MVQCERFETYQEQVQRKRQRRAIFRHSNSLIEGIILLMGLFLALDDKSMTPCALALTLSSRSIDTLPISSMNAKECGQSSGRIRSCSHGCRCTIIQPSGIRNLFHPEPYYRSNTALCSTTEKSTNEGTPAATFLSSSKSPAVVTTASNNKNTAKKQQRRTPKEHKRQQ